MKQDYYKKAADINDLIETITDNIKRVNSLLESKKIYCEISGESKRSGGYFIFDYTLITEILEKEKERLNNELNILKKQFAEL